MRDRLGAFYSMFWENENVFLGLIVICIIRWGKMSVIKCVKVDVEKCFVWSFVEVIGDEYGVGK